MTSGFIPFGKEKLRPPAKDQGKTFQSKLAAFFWGIVHSTIHINISVFLIFIMVNAKSVCPTQKF